MATGRVNFALSVGTRIPDSIEVYTFPKQLWISFRNIAASDTLSENELIIVDPDTLEIVAVLPGNVPLDVEKREASVAG